MNKLKHGKLRDFINLELGSWRISHGFTVIRYSIIVLSLEEHLSVPECIISYHYRCVVEVPIDIYHQAYVLHLFPL